MIKSTGRPMVLSVNDSSMVGEARRSANALAGRLGFSESVCARIAIVVTEAVTNLHKHTSGGEIVVQGWEEGDASGIDILALDKGPGMISVDRCLADGYSTAGSSGTGLGAMARLSDEFDIFSLPESGTATFARFKPRATTGLEFGFVSLPLPSEEVCGDGWAIEEDSGCTTLFMVDGLGHGPQAAEAATQAIESFRETAFRTPTEIIQAAHDALRSTRGAAIAVARLELGLEQVRFAGVGNIAAAIFKGNDCRSSSLVSHNGIVGHTIRKVQEFVYPFFSNSLLLMHSDGLGTQWQLDRYPGLATRHPGLIAGTLYRDFKRIRDDVTVLAVRTRRVSP